MKTFSASNESAPSERRVDVEGQVNAWLEQNSNFRVMSQQVIGIQESGKGTMDFAVFILYEILPAKK